MSHLSGTHFPTSYHHGRRQVALLEIHFDFADAALPLPSSSHTGHTLQRSRYRYKWKSEYSLMYLTGLLFASFHWNSHLSCHGWCFQGAPIARLVHVRHEVAASNVLPLRRAHAVFSTLTSQVAMTLGGSRFPGALGAMLMEILPFLRGIASDIRSTLGDDHPGLIPTVMAAYALTSFLTGLAFIFLGLLRLGNLVGPFTVDVPSFLLTDR